jgi:predicted nucleotide-binding protein
MAKDVDLFGQINNAVLDLQASQLQSFERPLKTLARLLHNPDLEAINRPLIERVNFEAFMAASECTGGGMVGSHHLVWPDDSEQVLGLTLILIDRLAADPDYATNIGYRYFYSNSNEVIAGIHALTRQHIIPFVRDYKTYVLSRGNAAPRLNMRTSNKVFIVHGRDESTKNEAALFLSSIGLEPIILHTRPHRGRHLLLKFQEESEGAAFAVVLITPDDEGALVGGTPRKRARQNVVFELGFLIGKLGTPNVAALVKGDVERPSDFDGIGYIDFDPNGEWKRLLAREMHDAQIPFDASKVFTA